MSHERLAAILTKGDTKACAAFFAELEEKDRKVYAEQALAWFKQVNAKSIIWISATTATSNPLLPASDVAVLASCSLGQLKNLGRGCVPEEDLAFAVLAARRPEWLNDWIEWFCEQLPHRWPLVRRLIHARLCSKPKTDHYVLGMIVGLCPYHDNKRTIYDALLADTDLLKDDVWRLFEVEGNGDLTLAGRDKYSRGDNTWTHAFLRLAQEKKLPRARLLDASLAALKRDFSQFHAGWFSQFHEALEPTDKERAERGDSYLHLLASRIPPTVSFALKALQLLETKDKIDPQALLDAIRPALWNRHKGTARIALQLIDKTVRKHPELGSHVGNVVAEALNHESPDVQKLAVDLLAKHAPMSPELAATLTGHLANVAASQRTRLQRLLLDFTGSGAEQPKARQAEPALKETALRKRAERLDKRWRDLAGVDAVLAALKNEGRDIPALTFDPLAIPRLDPADRIEPLDTLDGLIDSFIPLLEDPSNPAEVERALDGVSRLCDQRPDDFAARTGALRKRALDRLARLFAGPFVGCGVLVDLCGVARAWLCGEVVLPERGAAHKFDKSLVHYEYANTKQDVEFFVHRRPNARTFLSLRALEIARRSAVSQAWPLLAAPTHLGGWIDPMEVVGRALELQSRQVKADPLDQVQALLRLAPDRRNAARRGAKKVQGEFGRALRYALGGDENVGPDAALWIAAARARSPLADDDKVTRKHPSLGPDAGQAARYQPEFAKRYNVPVLLVSVEPKVPTSPAVELVTVLMNPPARKEGEFDHVETRASMADLRWIMSVWPANRETWFARVSRPFADNLDWWEAHWDNRTFLEPLLEHDTPLGPMALLMLALGLAAKDPGENGLATDALISAVEDWPSRRPRPGPDDGLLAPVRSGQTDTLGKGSIASGSGFTPPSPCRDPDH